MAFSEGVVYKDAHFPSRVEVKVVALFGNGVAVRFEVVAFLEADYVHRVGTCVVQKVGQGGVSLVIQVVGERWSAFGANGAVVRRGLILCESE